MSEMWSPGQFTGAERVPAWTRPPSRGFAARPPGSPASFSPWTEEEHAPPVNTDAIAEEAYAIGLADGRATVEAEVAAERHALTCLAEAIDGLAPEPPAALAALIAETVKRLAGQIVGESQIDAALLAERAHAVAALIAEESAPARVRLHPDDLARLEGARFDLEAIADPSLAPGTIVAESGAGWIEDGPAMRLDKLRTLLDRMGAPR